MWVNNYPQTDMSLHLDTLSWILGSQYLLLPLHTVYVAENQQISRSITFLANTLTISPPSQPRHSIIWIFPHGRLHCIHGGPKVGLQFFHYLFHVSDLIYPNHNFKLVFHIPYSHFGNVLKLFPPISEAFIEIDADRDLCRAVCHSVLEMFEECCNVERGHLEHLRD